VDDFAAPPIVQAGKPFTVLSSLTVWCYLLPRVRVDLLDATFYQILSSISLLPLPSSSGIYVISLAENATARYAPGSWALEIQAYVLDEASGFSVGRWVDLFQILVVPYPPQGTTQATNSPSLATLSTSFNAHTYKGPIVLPLVAVIATAARKDCR
jgi:hypothetical protein